MVTTDRQAAIATMDSFRQRLVFDGVTLWAFLACIPRVYFDQLATSVFSFVAQHGNEGRPAYIVNRFREHPTRQAFYVQVFDYDGPEISYKFACFLVLKIFTLIG